MSTTITVGVDDFTPDIAVAGYTARRAGRNTIHRILGTSAPAVTLAAAMLRAGTLTCVFSDEAIAWAMVAALSGGTDASLASTDRAVIDMNFVISGDVTATLDPTGAAWIVAFDWQEI